MRSNLIVDKTYKLSQRIIRANHYLVEKKEYVIS